MCLRDKNYKKACITVLQISITTDIMNFSFYSTIGLVEFQTSSNRSFKCGESLNHPMYHISVPGKHLAFISGTTGIAVDSLAFYYI